MFEKALAGGRTYRIWWLMLTAALAAGMLCYGNQLRYGLGITGLGNDINWGLYIAQFTFLSGIAASSAVVVLLLYLSDGKEFRNLAVLSEFMAISAIVAAVLFVIADTGQPARIFNIVLHAAPGSMMFWDMVALGGYLLLNLAMSREALRAGPGNHALSPWAKVLILISVPWAIGMRTVATLLYSGLPGRSYWLTAVLAPRALASAAASGLALLILLSLILRQAAAFHPRPESLRRLAGWAGWAIVGNLFLSLMEAFTVLYSGIPDLTEHFRYLFVGLDGHTGMVAWNWTSLAFSVAGAIMLLTWRTHKHAAILATGCVTALCAVWIEKGLSQVVGGFVPSPFGAVSDFSPTVAEITVAAGIWAAALMLMTLFCRLAFPARREAAPQEMRIEAADLP